MSPEAPLITRKSRHEEFKEGRGFRTSYGHTTAAYPGDSKQKLERDRAKRSLRKRCPYLFKDRRGCNKREQTDEVDR